MPDLLRTIYRFFVNSIQWRIQFLLWSLIQLPGKGHLPLSPDCVAPVSGSPLRSQSLPANPYSLSLDPEPYYGYEKCLRMEQATDDSIRLMYARFLGYLITEAPDKRSQSLVSLKILECMKVDLLAQFYITHLFRLFRKDKGYSPPSYRSQRFSFPNDSVRLAPDEYKAAKHAALLRDEYRCMVTGSVDSAYYDGLSVDELISNNLKTTESSPSDFSHIFPASIYQNLEPHTSKIHYAASILLIALEYGINIYKELEDAQRSSNGLTLSLDVHDEFDKLNLWFEAIPDKEHTYRICTSENNHIIDRLPPSRVVTFITRTHYELPDPKYLRLHASVCRVAHRSGVATYLDAYDCDQEEYIISPNDLRPWCCIEEREEQSSDDE